MSERFRMSRLMARQLKEHGISETAVLRRAGLWDGWLRQEKILATTEELFAFWRAVEEVSGNPTVGLRLGPNFSVDDGTPQTIAALHSESFADAVQRIARYKKLTCPEEVRLTRSGDESAIEFVFLFGANTEPAVLVDCCLAWILDIGQRGTGTLFRCRRTSGGWDGRFPGPPRSAAISISTSKRRAPRSNSARGTSNTTTGAPPTQWT